MLHMKNCIQQIYFRLKQTSERNALMQKKISSLLYCVLKSIIMHLTYLFNNKLRNVVNISFKLKNNDGTPYTLVLTAVFWCRLNSFRFVFCLIVWKSLKWNQKKINVEKGCCHEVKYQRLRTGTEILLFQFWNASQRDDQIENPPSYQIQVTWYLHLASLRS